MKKCHLSGLIVEAESDNSFILIPMAYKLSQTNFLTYLTSESVYPLSLPIITNNLYDNNDKNNVILNIFKADLSNNTNKKYYSLKTNDIEYLSDIELLNKIEKETIEKINLDSNLAALNNMFIVNNNNVLRMGYILINVEFLNVLIEKNYSDYKSLIQENIQELIKKYMVKENNFNATKNISMVELHNALGFKNEELYTFENILKIMNIALKCYNEEDKNYDDNFQKILDSLLLMSMIYKIYNDLGKSFYPKPISNYSNKLINKFSEFVSNYANQEMEGNYYCHLSRMPIKENESVLCIPMSYEHIDVNLYYVTSDEVTPCFVPFNSIYNGKLGVEEEKNTMSVLFSKYLESKSNSTFYKYAIDDSSEYKNSIVLLNDIKNDKYKKEMIGINNFKDYVSVSHDSLVRHGYLLIKRDFFDKYIAENYSELKKKIYDNLIDVVMKDKDKSKMIRFDNDYYDRENSQVRTEEVRKALMFFNGSDESIISITRSLSYLREKYKTESIDLLNNTKFIDTINSLVDLGLLKLIYRELGKSFYPELNRLNIDHFISFHSLIVDYTNKRADSFEKDYGNKKWFF